MADSQHPIPAEKSLLSRSKARKGSVLDQKSVHTGLKAHLSAQTTDFLPDTGYNADEKIRSDMGFLIPQDMFRRSETHKSLQDKAVSPVLILYQRVQFAVGKGSGTALPELNIGGGIQHACLPEGGHVPETLLRRSAAFEENRAQAPQSEEIAAEKSRGACTDNNRRRHLFSAGTFPEDCRGKGVGHRIRPGNVRTVFPTV